MDRWWLVVLGVLACWSAAPAEGASRPNLIHRVTVQEEAGHLAVRLAFQRPIAFSAPAVENLGDKLQLTLPGSLIHPAKQYLDVGDERLPQVFAYQYQEDVVRVRLYLGEGVDAAALARDARIRLEGKTLLWKVPYPAPSSEATGWTAWREDPVPDAAGLSLPARRESSGVKIQEGPKRASLSRASAGKVEHPSLLASALKMLSALSLVLALVFVSVHAARRLLKGRGLGPGRAIQVLASHYLGPKQSIALVEVAGEVLVLALSPNDVRLLTKVDNVEALQRLMARESGDAEGSFRQALSRVMERWTRRPSARDRLGKERDPLVEALEGVEDRVSFQRGGL